MTVKNDPQNRGSSKFPFFPFFPFPLSHFSRCLVEKKIFGSKKKVKIFHKFRSYDHPQVTKTIPETADEWEGLFYPTTTHFSSQGGDSMTAAEAFEYCGRWRTAVRPMLSQEELRKASALCNRLRSLVQTRLRSAA